MLRNHYKIFIIWSFILYSSNAFAQWNFWHSMLNQSKCAATTVRSNCQAHLSAGCNSGSYKINESGPVVTVFCESSTPQNKTYYSLKQDVDTNYILNNASTTNSLYQIASQLTMDNSLKTKNWTNGSVYSMKHGSTIIPTEFYSFPGGTYADNSAYCSATSDTNMCITRFTGNTTLTGLHTPQTRKKGWIIFVDGNLTINSGASLSMTARGAIATGQNLTLVGTNLVPAIGTSGGTGVSVTASNGEGGVRISQSNWDAIQAPSISIANTSTYGACGGGNAGGAASWYNPAYNATSGSGSAGTSYSGGSGGGGAGARFCSSSAGAAASNGGQGGTAVSNCSDWNSAGGSGNPGGVRGGNTSYTLTGNSGTGGLIVIFVKGNLINNGSIVAKGVDGVGAMGSGGASGGGSVNVFYSGTLSGSGTISAAGGVNSGGNTSYSAGKGTERILSTSLN